MSSVIIDKKISNAIQNVAFSDSISFVTSVFVGGVYVAIKNIQFSAQNLPSGLNIDSNYGIIYGTPTVVGSYSVLIKVNYNLSTDLGNPPVNYSDSQFITINVKPVLDAIIDTLPSGSQILNNPYTGNNIVYNAPSVTTGNFVDVIKSQTGYLYVWGNGLYGSDLVPNILTGSLVSGIAYGNNINFAILANQNQVDTTQVLDTTPDLNSSGKRNNFKFVLYNSFKDNYIDKFKIFSTSSGTDYQLINKLRLLTTGGDIGVYQKRKITSLNFDSSYRQVDSFYTGIATGKTNYQTNGTYLRIKDSNKAIYTSGNTYGSGSSYNFNIRDNGGQGNNLYIDYKSNSSSPTYISGLFRQALNIENTGIIRDIIEKVDSADYAWASYDYTNLDSFPYKSSNVFSYAIEIAKQSNSNFVLIEGSTGSGLYTGYKSTLLPILNTGITSLFEEYTNFCVDSVSCGPPPPPLEDIEICWSGGNATGNMDYIKFISGIKKAFKDNVYVANYDNIPVGYKIKSGQVNSPELFSSETGSIIYNSFQQGDSITFNTYGYDYSGMYKSYHKGNNPLYPAYQRTFVYGQDFNSIESLVSVLNTNLRDTSRYLWYPYKCLSGVTATGVYGTGGLLEFQIDNSPELSGTVNYNNIIKFKSLRNNNFPYGITLNLTARIDNIQNYNNQYYTGISYLLPDTIELQGWDDNSGKWLVLDKQDGIYSTLTGIVGTNINLTYADKELYEKYSLSATYEPSLPPVNDFGYNFTITSGVNFLSTQDIVLPPTGGHQVLQSFSQKSVEAIPGFGCGVVSGNRKISIVIPSGWPSGSVSGCNIKQVSGKNFCDIYAQQLGLNLVTPDDADCGENGFPLTYQFDDDFGTVCVLCSGLSGKRYENKWPFSAEVIRTGWNLNTTGQYLSCLTSGSNYYPFDLNFTKYRVKLSNFNGRPYTPQSYSLKQSPEIYITNINLFGSQRTGSIIHNIGGDCPIGSNYSVTVAGTVPFYIQSYPYNYIINSQDMKGKYNAYQDLVTYTPNEYERIVKFINSSGKFVGDVTGLVSKVFIPSGYITKNLNNYFFYDTGSKNITFEKTYSKYVVGSGYLSGTETIVKQSVINQQLLTNGALTSLTQYVTISSPGLVSGIMYNAVATITGITGNYYMPATVQGMSNNGYYNYNTIITGAPQYTLNNYPYYIIPTGYVNSTASVNIDVSKLNLFDNISINNSIVSYAADNISYPSPQFFDSITGLVSIINSASSNFGCTGYVDQSDATKINLVSILSGESGNSIQLSANNSSGVIFGSTNFTGGKNLYVPLSAITTVFSGRAIGSVASTGNYSVTSNSGVLTGNINAYYGTRYFSNVWNIATGYTNVFNSFGINNLNAKNSIYSGNTILSNSPYDSILQLNIQYNSLNYIGISANPDIARVTISGVGFPTGQTGISFLISGY